MNHENRSLYRFEYYEPEDNETYVDWVWLADDELDDYKSSYTTYKVRPATSDESDLYDEAYSDGYGMAAMIEFESKDDGITYRVELDENGSLKQGAKMFCCATCNNHKDFETEVATANGMYLTALKGDEEDAILWHLCFDCATLQMELDGIEVDFTEEGEAGS